MIIHHNFGNPSVWRCSIKEHHLIFDDFCWFVLETKTLQVVLFSPSSPNTMILNNAHHPLVASRPRTWPLLPSPIIPIGPILSKNHRCIFWVGILHNHCLHVRSWCTFFLGSFKNYDSCLPGALIKQPVVEWMDMVISNRFSCKDLVVHHASDWQWTTSKWMAFEFPARPECSRNATSNGQVD